MKIVKALTLFIFTLLAFTQCSSGGDEQDGNVQNTGQEKTYPAVLAAEWSSSATSDPLADKFTLNENGSGSYSTAQTGGKLTWWTNNKILHIELDNKRVFEGVYNIDGATLILDNGRQKFIATGSLTGRWQAVSTETDEYLYNFNADGSGSVQMFDRNGLLGNAQQLDWTMRSKSEATIIIDYKTTDLKYSYDGNVLTINGATYKKADTPLLLGTWKAAYTEKGNINTGNPRYSMVEMSKEEHKYNDGYDYYFYCEYKSDGYKSSYQATLEIYDGMLILMSEGEDAVAVEMRYKRNSGEKRLALELCKEKADFTEYTGYYKE